MSWYLFKCKESWSLTLVHLSALFHYAGCYVEPSPWCSECARGLESQPASQSSNAAEKGRSPVVPFLVEMSKCVWEQVEGCKVRWKKASTPQRFPKLEYLSVELVPSSLSVWLTGHRQLCSCYTAIVQECCPQLVERSQRGVFFS